MKRKDAARIATGNGSVLERLKPEEAASVLRRLLAAHPDLGAQAERIARSLLHEVTFKAVADEVEEAVRALDFEDLDGRAGRHKWGYVEPTEAAWEILEETVAPFLDDLRRQIELGLETEALEICKGVVLGLYRVEHGKGGELAEWAPDFPVEAAGGAVETWRNGGGGRMERPRTSGRRKCPAFPQDFVDRFVPQWGALITRVLSRTG